MPGIPENGCGDILMQTKVLPPFRLVNPEMFATFVMVSFQKSPTNISNDMTKNLILAAAMLLAGGAVAAQPKVIAHRGYWTAPESAQNSIASFTKADAVGVFGSEIDVWLTADDKLIVNHDRIYKGTDVNMEKATAKEITAIVLPNGENIPTFDAYLKLVASKPDTRLILEMKSLSDYNREDLAAKKIVKQLKKYGVLDQTEIIAFSINACMAFKKLIPDTKIYYLNGDLAPKSIKKLGLAGIDYSMKRAPQKPRMGEAGARSGSRSQRLDRGRGSGHEILHRPGRGLHHHRLSRAFAGPAEEIGFPDHKKTRAAKSVAALVLYN